MIYMVHMIMRGIVIALSVFAGLIHLPIKEQPVERLQKA